MSSEHRLVVVFAHPDDESFGFAGMLSALADAGVDITYVVATRGECGEILVPDLATRATLGQVREQELRRAMELIGIREVRFLGFRDSGMAGACENGDPRAFVNQDVDAVARAVADVIAEKKPTIVLTYGPDGIYGHPDHIMAHKVTYAAVIRAGEDGRWRTPNLYYSAASRERIKRMATYPNGPFAATPPEELEKLGTPAGQITTWMDIRAYRERKLAALRAHRTQVGDDGPFARLPEEERLTWLSIETARMVPLPWNPNPVDILAEYLPPAALDHPFRG